MLNNESKILIFIISLCKNKSIVYYTYFTKTDETSAEVKD